MLIFSVSFQFFVCHSEEDIILWESFWRFDAQTNCVRTAGFEASAGAFRLTIAIASKLRSKLESL